MYAYIQMCMYVYIYIYICMYVCMYVCTYVYFLYIYRTIYIYANVYTYVYTYMTMEILNFTTGNIWKHHDFPSSCRSFHQETPPTLRPRVSPSSSGARPRPWMFIRAAEKEGHLCRPVSVTKDLESHCCLIMICRINMAIIAGDDHILCLHT